MPTRHTIKCRQRRAGFSRRWLRIDLALDLHEGEVIALRRTGRGRAVVVTFSPYARWWHKLFRRKPADRKVFARDLIGGRYASFTVPASDASTVEQALRAKAKLFLQQIVDAQAIGDVRSYDLDTGSFVGAEP